MSKYENLDETSRLNTRYGTNRVEENELLINQPEEEETRDPKPKSERLTSLDAVRGLSMLIMILVNNGPQGPPSWWGHAQWDGMGLADWVMPLFLAIGGTSMSLSLAKILKKNASKWEIFKKILIRTIKLFALGLLVQGLRNPESPCPCEGGPDTVRSWPYCDLDIIRIMGVLQRIALCYFISGTAFLFCPPLNISKDKTTRFKDIFLQVPVKYVLLWFVGIVFMIVFLGLTFGLYVPTYQLRPCNARGSLTETCNAMDYLDYTVLGSNHLYMPYHEPEGLFSSFMALGSTFFGLYLGLVLYEFSSHYWRLGQWISSSIILLGVGLIAFSVGVPINKKIYSLSYCFITGGGMGLILSFFYVILDIFQNKIIYYITFPLVFFGMNAIVVYVGDSLLWKILRFVYIREPSNNLYDWFNGLFYNPDYESYVGSHLWALTHVLFWMIVSYILYRKNWFFKI